MRPLAVLLLVLCCANSASAHGLLLDAEHHADTIRGTVYYSNGEVAVRESVELLDLSMPDTAAIAGQTDNEGKFSFPVTATHRYRLSAHGEEGHRVDVEIDAIADARPTLVDDDASADESGFSLPAWAVLGILMFASVVPILLSRYRRR